MEDTRICSNWDDPISITVYDLHTVHWSRFLYKWKVCGDKVNKKDRETHDNMYHATRECEYCCADLDDKDYEAHIKRCELRPMPWQYWEAVLTFEVRAEHEEACGSRTELCEECGNRIMVKELPFHFEIWALNKALAENDTNIVEEEVRVNGNKRKRKPSPPKRGGKKVKSNIRKK